VQVTKHSFMSSMRTLVPAGAPSAISSWLRPRTAPRYAHAASDRQRLIGVSLRRVQLGLGADAGHAGHAGYWRAQRAGLMAESGPGGESSRVGGIRTPGGATG
jgi:hypothetical protein